MVDDKFPGAMYGSPMYSNSPPNSPAVIYSKIQKLCCVD